MVKLGIVSDSHNTPFRMDQFIALANRAGYDAVFHLGDGEGETRRMKKAIPMPVYCVAGNCDWGSRLPGELYETFEGCRLLAVHGHRYEVKWGLERLSYYAESHGAKVALYGHTHIPNAEYCGPVLMFNPGALMRGCYGELVIDGNRVTPYLKTLEG